MKRTFIAIDIPASSKINECLDTMSSRFAGEKIKWVDGNNLHLTLKFLGNTGDKAVGDIKIILKGLTRNISAFTIAIRNVGVFRNLKNPRIIWLGIDACNELMHLYADIESQISPLGFPAEERKFSPHLTVGRIKFLENNQGLLQIIKAFEGQELHQFVVPEVIFYESILKKEGPEYIPLGKYKLRNL
jgi:2'-5' RNA ligase